MLYWIFAFLFLLPSFVFAGTDIISFKDPAIASPYGVVLISVNSDLRNKKTSEEKAIRELAKKSTSKFYSELELFSPLKTYSSDEILKILKEKRIEAVLYAEVVGATENQFSITFPIFQTTYGNIGGNSVNLVTQGTSQIPYAVAEWRTKLQMFDVNKAKVIWIADAETSGWTESGMRNNLIKNTIKETLAAGLVQKIETPTSKWHQFQQSPSK